MNKKEISTILNILFVIITLIIGFYLGTKYQLDKNPNLYKNPSSLWQTTTDQSLKGWHIYINPRFKFAFKYPELAHVQEIGYYYPAESSFNNYSRGELLNLYLPGYNNAVKDILYDTKVSIHFYTNKNTEKFLDFVKKINYLSAPGGEPYMEMLPNENYHSTKIDGREAIIVDYFVTDKILKEMEKVYSAGMVKPLPKRPEDYKTKIVYIRDKDFIFILNAGSLLQREDAVFFDQILSTFKFLP